ncbi:hypothetical protein CKM354_000341300 [Cercospora kikuchii]|uniref:Oxidoreductase n=1 Tax=Cercospora kikuchii TaxID=84275 RepID=A0A9P3C9G6_9PEZI|nr:uncharacterized protein CKM354_000341300 [Cercospora kikuchii]GIZ40059.1 hypothetical protein CKM354_000341300 [Cercospora kikuchii]
MSLAGKNVLITGASMGIGAAIARRLAKQKANLILLARNEKKLQELARELQVDSGRLVYCTADVSRYDQVEDAVRKAVKEVGDIDILVNNAGLALGAPEKFPDLKIEDIVTMTGTNINGYMFAAYAVLNAGGMKNRKRGTILNVTSVTGLEVPPFPGEAVYHSSKAAQEAFTNVLRAELQETNIKVLALRPGIVATHFHRQRVGGDRKLYDDFMEGMEPLLDDDVAEAAAFMIGSEERVSVTSISVTPTAQRTLQVIDRTWNARNQQGGSSSQQNNSQQGNQGGQQNSRDQRGSNNSGEQRCGMACFGHTTNIMSGGSQSNNQGNQHNDERRGSNNNQSNSQGNNDDRRGSSQQQNNSQSNQGQHKDQRSNESSHTNNASNNNDHNSQSSSGNNQSSGSSNNQSSSSSGNQNSNKNDHSSNKDNSNNSTNTQSGQNQNNSSSNNGSSNSNSTSNNNDNTQGNSSNNSSSNNKGSSNNSNSGNNGSGGGNNSGNNSSGGGSGNNSSGGGGGNHNNSGGSNSGGNGNNSGNSSSGGGSGNNNDSSGGGGGGDNNRMPGTY